MKQRSVAAFFLGGAGMTVMSLVIPTQGAVDAGLGLLLLLFSLLLGGVQLLVARQRRVRAEVQDGLLMLLGNVCVIVAALGETLRFGSQVSAQVMLWPMVFAAGFLGRRWWPWQALLGTLGLFILGYVKALWIGAGGVWWVDSLVVAVSMLVTGVVVVYFRLAAEREAQELSRQSVTDPLTGLANRRALPDEFARLLRGTPPSHQVGLVMFDLDYFKRVNDRFGHQVGDQVLQTAARLLGAQAGQTHLLARMGGEEFLWVLPGPEAKVLVTQVEALRTSISRDAAMRGVTLSAGLVMRERHTLTSEDWLELLTLADRALYRAKEDGRNCLRVAPDALPAACPLTG